MIVYNKWYREEIKAERSQLTIGMKGKDDSGMGGTFPVELIGIDDKGYTVQVTKKYWNKLTYCVSEERACQIFEG